jgi:hypothetical protein
MLTDMVQKNRFGVNAYPNSVFWRNDDGEIIFEKDSLGRFWVSANLWERISDFFGLTIDDYTDVANMFKHWLIKYLNIESPKVFRAHHKDWGRWENLTKDPKKV